ncbi:hypothetical protein NQ318_009568 [Aromia moschata]|uniref:Integrase catalytic domain-containing protein n=1 Tax=Aromia moschata TaxID=1265417 RepID=A0AAV8WZR1_9CUCU|nr:hypothetical protein NQ318_009568 [Aromia moschata]
MYCVSCCAVERMNRSINRYLSKVVSDHQRDWDQFLHLFLLAYRSSIHETTGQIPASIVMSRELRLPCDLKFGCTPGDDVAGEDYVSTLRQRMDDIHERVRSSIQGASDRMKETYDINANDGSFPKLICGWDFPNSVYNCLLETGFGEPTWSVADCWFNDFTFSFGQSLDSSSLPFTGSTPESISAIYRTSPVLHIFRLKCFTYHTTHRHSYITHNVVVGYLQNFKAPGKVCMRSSPGSTMSSTGSRNYQEGNPGWSTLTTWLLSPEAMTSKLKTEFDTSVRQAASSLLREFMLLHSNGQKTR